MSIKDPSSLENLQTLWVDGIIVLDAEGKTDCEYSTDESLANEITEEAF